MKQAIVVCAFILAFAATASAQPGTSFGARVGANFANLNFDPDEGADTSTRTGIAAGVFATMPAGDRFSFQPEVLFSQQGAKIQEGGDEGKVKLNYINVGALGNFRLSSGDNPVSLIVGPQLGFRTSAKGEFGSETEDLKDDTESTDIGIVAGLAATIRNFVVDARYTHGLRNIATDDEEKVKQRVFTVSVGVLFR